MEIVAKLRPDFSGLDFVPEPGVDLSIVLGGFLDTEISVSIAIDDPKTRRAHNYYFVVCGLIAAALNELDGGNRTKEDIHLQEAIEVAKLPVKRGTIDDKEVVYIDAPSIASAKHKEITQRITNMIEYFTSTFGIYIPPPKTKL